MKSMLLAIGFAIMVLTAVVWLGSVRVLVTAPVASYREGATFIVAKAPHLRLLDSPQVICKDKPDSTRNFCAAGTIAGVKTFGMVLLTLPFSETLHQMAGAP